MAAPPAISIVIPAYNRAKFIGAAVGSVLGQTFKDFELIVWDDGSTDGTADVATAAAGNDSRVRIVRAEHRGLGAAMNAGVAEARGKFIGQVDSDDAIAPTALAETAGYLDAHPNAGLVYTQYVTMDENGRLGAVGKRCAIPYSKERLLIDFMVFHFRLIRRDLFERSGGYDSELEAAIDYDFCLRLSEITQIEHLARPLYFYRVHKGSLSSAKRLQQIELSKQAIARALERRGMAGEFEIDVEIVGKFRLTKKRSG